MRLPSVILGGINRCSRKPKERNIINWKASMTKGINEKFAPKVKDTPFYPSNFVTIFWIPKDPKEELPPNGTPTYVNGNS